MSLENQLFSPKKKETRLNWNTPINPHTIAQIIARVSAV